MVRLVLCANRGLGARYGGRLVYPGYFTLHVHMELALVVARMILLTEHSFDLRNYSCDQQNSN